MQFYAVKLQTFFKKLQEREKKFDEKHKLKSESPTFFLRASRYFSNELYVITSYDKKHLSFIRFSIWPLTFLYFPKLQSCRLLRGLWRHASLAYFVLSFRQNLRFMWQKCGIFEKVQPQLDYSDFDWWCMKLCNRIIVFFWRDWRTLSLVVKVISLEQHFLFEGYNKTMSSIRHCVLSLLTLTMISCWMQVPLLRMHSVQPKQIDCHISSSEGTTVE